MRSVKKYAIRFPGLDSCRNQESLSIFSENRFIETQKTFSSVLNTAESLAGFIVQKSRTNELGKRILVQKEALDIEIENRTEQLKNQYVEESKRWKIRLENEKKEMELDFQRLMMETAEQSKKLGFSFEKYMQANQILYNIVLHEKKIIEDIQPYIEMLADDYSSNRREYIKYCEIERKSIELINVYINQMMETGGISMAKLNYSKFKDKGPEVVPASKVEVLPAPNQYDVSTSRSGEGLGQSLANAASPVAAICDCVKAAFGTIEIISECAAAVSIEKQKTEQVKAMYKAQIVESKEQTTRIKVQEKEETKRLKITCENKLKLQKKELQKLSMELESKEKSMILSHKEYADNINILQKALDGIMDTKREVYLLINQCNGDTETIEMHLHSLHAADEKLIEIAKQVSNMKGV